VKTTSSLIKLIIFALVTLVTFGTLAATIANISFGDRATYTAVFTDVTGLTRTGSAPSWSSGQPRAAS